MSVLIIVFLTAVLALFAGVFQQGKYSRYLGIFGLLIAFAVSYYPEAEFFKQYQTMFHFNETAALFTRVILVTTTLIFMLGGFAFNNHRSHQSELYALMLFAVTGGIILLSFTNMVTLFLGIEILSIPLYAMAGTNKRELRSTEAAMKYFLMGAFATGFLLFGIALVYGATGTFDIYKIHLLSINSDGGVLMPIGVIMILAALAFKVSLAPFHMWSPDVYQGSPSIITTFMASVVKTAAFYAMFRVMTIAFTASASEWLNIVGVLVIITLLLANVMGLAQGNAKRMLAYSSVSHAGYIAIIFFGFSSLSLYHLAFYLFAYSVATVGVFTVLIYTEKVKRETSFEAFNGLGKKEPLLAVVATVSMLSMAGIPLLAGFVAKFNIFAQAIETAPFLVLVAVIASAISIAYYLKLIIAMFFNTNETFEKAEDSTLTYKAVGLIVLVVLFVAGIYPDIFTVVFNR